MDSSHIVVTSKPVEVVSTLQLKPGTYRVQNKSTAPVLVWLRDYVTVHRDLDARDAVIVQGTSPFPFTIGDRSAVYVAVPNRADRSVVLTVFDGA